MLKLYGFSKVNAGARGHTRDLRVLWALKELQLPFELVGLDHPAHDLSNGAYRRLSPFDSTAAGPERRATTCGSRSRSMMPPPISPAGCYGFSNNAGSRATCPHRPTNPGCCEHRTRHP